MPSAASAENSRNGEPGSTSRSIRSRAVIFPRLRWRSTAAAPPPSRTRAKPPAQLLDQRGHRGSIPFPGGSLRHAPSVISRNARLPSAPDAGLSVVRIAGRCETARRRGVMMSTDDRRIVSSGRASSISRRALEPYAGPWDVRQAAHLFRRAGFGGSPDDVAAPRTAGMQAAVDGFVHFADTSALPAQPQLVDDRPDRVTCAPCLRAPRCNAMAPAVAAADAADSRGAQSARAGAAARTHRDGAAGSSTA